MGHYTALQISSILYVGFVPISRVNDRKKKSAIIVIGRDPNLPGIDYRLNTIVENQYPKTIIEEFLKLLQDHSLQQMVLEATRFNNT